MPLQEFAPATTWIPDEISSFSPVESHRLGRIAFAPKDGISFVSGGCNTPQTKEIRYSESSPEADSLAIAGAKLYNGHRLLKRGLLRFESEGNGIHTIPETSRLRAIIKNMPEMSSASTTQYFNTFHSIRYICIFLYMGLVQWSIKAWPACT